MSRRMRLRSSAVALGLVLLGTICATAGDLLLPPGFRPAALGTHALVGARVFPQPGVLYSNATVVIRAGRIVAVGPDVTPPPDARVWDLSGHTLYPGFIDPYLTWNPGAPKEPKSPTEAAQTGGAHATASEIGPGGYRFFGVPGEESDPGTPGPGARSRAIVPETRVSDRWAPDEKLLEELRDLGFTAALAVPSEGILRGQSAFVTLGSRSPNESILDLGGNRGVAQHISLELPSAGRFPPRADGFPSSLMGVIAAIRQAFLDAEAWAAARAEFTAHPQTARPVPFNHSLQALQETRHGQPVFFDPGSLLMVDRARRLAAEFSLSNVVMVASGQEWRRPDLIAGTTTDYIVPVAFPEAPRFPDDADWDAVSLDTLRAWDWAPENPALLRRHQADIALTTHGLSRRKDFRKYLVAALDRGLSESDALAALTIVPARFAHMDSLLGTLTPGKLAHLTICDARGYFDPEGKVLGVWVNGEPFPGAPTNSVQAAKTNTIAPTAPGSDAKKPDLRKLARVRKAREPLSDRTVPAQPPSVLITNATIWTCGPLGVLTNASLMVNRGILGVGVFTASWDRDGTHQSVTGPAAFVGNDIRTAMRSLPDENTQVINGTGLHITPGLIDAHSHSMILGGVNEPTLPSTAMVRIADVINSESETIHQQLAGGLTIANLLHGSANPIGGQSQVIKLRNGASPEDLRFTNAPAGIKFALGENVKQANWGDQFTTRFPQSRMGVPTFFRNRFTAARQYQSAWNEWNQRRTGTPPRRDLELEALVEILDGRRRIHCHSYRQDEIVVFLRTMEEFGIRVGTLQHVLEGYKVADEIARHGAGASAFADWWGYKFEVIDAIPYAGSLMRERGVNVSFNSDSDDLARRLNLEAAKAVKYGGTPEADALLFVTLNPALQLGIDRWVGSLEPGKDADFVIWSGHPLDSASLCLQTWIEGRPYFDRSREADRARTLAAERTALIDKAKQLAGAEPAPASGPNARDQFFRRALETARHLGLENCQECLLPRDQRTTP